MRNENERMNKKLIYVLNSYSETDSSHFTHILHLLNTMADKGCTIMLLIEKADSLPVFSNRSISVKSLSFRMPFFRHIELFLKICFLIRTGYRTTFVRIAAPASIAATLAHWLLGGRSFLWQSGTTDRYDKARPASLQKLKWWVTSYAANSFARRIVSRFVTGPEAMVDYYEKEVGIPRSKIVLLYNDIELARFQTLDGARRRDDFCLKHNIDPDALVLLLVHRLSPVRKTLSYLEPTWTALRDANLPSWVFIIAGGGSELPAAKKLAERLGVSDKIFFLGDVPNRSVPDLYSTADLFIHPTYTEGFPRVMIEAMASGLPIVTTDAGGTRQLLGDQQQAYVVDRASPKLFASMTLELIRAQNDWEKLSSENRKVVVRFSTPNVAEMYLRALFP